MEKIFIIEDESAIRDELQILLKNAGFETEAAADFADIPAQVLAWNPDLILMDIGLPGLSGFELCTKIRSQSGVPIVFVTSRNTSMDELHALMLGGDDFIAKPYNPPVLLARIGAVLKRNRKDIGSDELICGTVTLHVSMGTVSAGGKSEDLTKNELKILYCLFQNQGKIVSRADLIEYLWDNQVYIDDNTLSVNVTRIREKLKQIGVPELIQTKRGMGYKV